MTFEKSSNRNRFDQKINQIVLSDKRSDIKLAKFALIWTLNLPNSH